MLPRRSIMRGTSAFTKRRLLRKLESKRSIQLRLEFILVLIVLTGLGSRRFSNEISNQYNSRMSTTASSLVQKVWNYAHVLKDDGLAFMDYTEQITFLLFLRMAHEREAIGSASVIPEKYNWTALSAKSGDALEVQYSKTLRELGKLPGLLGVILAKAQ